MRLQNQNQNQRHRVLVRAARTGRAAVTRWVTPRCVSGVGNEAPSRWHPAKSEDAH